MMGSKITKCLNFTCCGGCAFKSSCCDETACTKVDIQVPQDENRINLYIKLGSCCEIRRNVNAVTPVLPTNQLSK